jgi:hypothetical protein
MVAISMAVYLLVCVPWYLVTSATSQLTAKAIRPIFIVIVAPSVTRLDENDEIKTASCRE